MDIILSANSRFFGRSLIFIISMKSPSVLLCIDEKNNFGRFQSVCLRTSCNEYNFIFKVILVLL